MIAIDGFQKVRKTLIYSVGILCILDAVLTLLDLHLGVGTEANPIMAALITFSPWVFLLFKTILGGMFVWLFQKTDKYNKTLVAITALYSFVVWNNILVLFYVQFFHKNI